MNSADPDSAKLSLSLESHEVSERVAEVMIEFARFRAQEGIFTKPSVMAAARRLPPSSWWRTFGAHLPSLQDIAISVLSQPLSAGAAERNWSVYGAIKSDKRVRMQHEVADKRVFCHEALHYAEELQGSNYHQSVEKWSDSESDDSDCERDQDDEPDAIAGLLM